LTWWYIESLEVKGDIIANGGQARLFLTGGEFDADGRKLSGGPSLFGIVDFQKCTDGQPFGRAFADLRF
jgi:hypothetical protein